MIYARTEDLIGTEREAVGDGWMSRRFLVARDGLPFSVHETTVLAGTVLHLDYRKHSETVYCIDGKAVLEDVAGDRMLDIGPGVFYSVGSGEEHVLRIEQDTRFLCVFDPPLRGQEAAD